MSDKLRKPIEDILWMAIRYANGRHTYAPSMVRDAVEIFKEVYPDFEIKGDITIKPPTEDQINSVSLMGDHLYDLVNQNKVKGPVKIVTKKDLKENIKDLKENILDIINSENSGLSHQERLNEIEKLLK